MSSAPHSSAEKEGRFQIEPLAAATTLGSIATPVALLLTGMLYLSGWAYHTTFLQEFGLEFGYQEESLQATLARGFMPTVYGCFVVVPAAAMMWYVEKWMKEHWHSHRALARAWRWYTVLGASYILLTFSLFAGHTNAVFDAWYITSDVDAGCAKECYIYRIHRVDILGHLVVQDKDRTAIYTKGGLLIFKSGDVHLIRSVESPASLKRQIYQP
jgi:hypothetical protein